MYEKIVQLKLTAKEGGIIAGNTRKEIEKKTGKKVITRKNSQNSRKRLNP